MIKKIIPIIVLVAIGSTSCGPKATTSTATAAKTEKAKPAGVISSNIPDETAASAEDLSAGKAIYEQKCNKCHELFKPEKYDKKRWVRYVDWMAPKAKLAEKDAQLVYVYLAKNSKV